MNWLHLIDTEKVLLFTLVLTRVTGLLMTTPVFGTTEAPATVRALLSFALAVLLVPAQWNAPLPCPDTMLQFVFMIGAELLVGVGLGLGLTVFLAGIQMSGELISRIGGLTLSDVFDPTSGDTIPLLSRVMELVSTAVFLVIGGHRIVLAGLLDTFQTIPPGGCLSMIVDPSQGASNATPWLTSMAEMFVVLTTQSFSLAVRAAIPVVTAVLLATLVVGLIGRTLPQLNVMAIGFGLNAMLTFAVLSLSFGAAILAFQNQIEPTLQTLFETLRIPSHPVYWYSG